MFELSVSPVGHFHLYETPGEEALSAVAAVRIREAFNQGEGRGLLHLGAVELETALPPSLAFGRELSQRFMVNWCAIADLATQWQQIQLSLPQQELEQLCLGAPPMVGAEYLDHTVLERAWQQLHIAAREEIREQEGDLTCWLQGKHERWSLLGRICFHLAENKNSPQTPFAFIATYAVGLAGNSQVQHQPLGKALQSSMETGDKAALLKLLQPINKAAQRSEWLQSLIESGAIFRPNAWQPDEAHRFLLSVPLFEESGIIVRIPDWWRSNRAPRPQVQVSIGRKAAGLGLDAMLDFNLSLALEGEPLTQEEWQALLAEGSGLVRLKGQWVEVNTQQLQSVLAHWENVQRLTRGEGVSFLEGMRLLAGAEIETDSTPTEVTHTVAQWSNVVAGEWLQEALQGLRQPQGAFLSVPELKATLRPYQQEGVQWLRWLSRLGLGGCLADDMGLGKTIQIISLLLLLQQEEIHRGVHLLVLPASLIGNWQEEIGRFAPGLRVWTAHSSALSVNALQQIPNNLHEIDVVLTSYGCLSRIAWLQEVAWQLVVLDEAQAIKNPGTQQARAARQLKSRVRLALTGTPIENQLSDLWSLFDFICPGLLGSRKVFAGFIKSLEKEGGINYAPLRRLVQPYILRRLKSDKRIISDLPDKTEVRRYCSLSVQQTALYMQAVKNLTQQLQEAEEGIQRRGLVLAFLMRLKQICNHPSHWSGDGLFTAEESGKFIRLREICEEIKERQEKVLIFTQFQEMTQPLADFLAQIFGRTGLILHGATSVKARKQLVQQFQQEEGPPFFVLSIKAGGTGLNLTAASHVVHFDRWWNPAVENQATDRAYRIGQKKNVLVHKFVCKGTIEEKIEALISEKQSLSQEMLQGEGAELRLTELSNEALLQMVALDINSAMIET